MTVLSRAEWSIVHPKWTTLGPTPHSVVHHTASHFAAVPSNPEQPLTDPNYKAALIRFLRATEAAEMNRPGDELIAVAYHWMFDPYGTIIEGRPVTAQGGATLHHNGDSRAYCAIGNFCAGDVPTKVMLDTIVAQMRTDMATLHLQPGVHPTWGHRDVFATACPCPPLYNALPHMRDLIANHIPIPDPIPAPEDTDVQPTDITGHLKTDHGEWFQQADGGIITIAGDYHGSYPGLPPQFHDNPNRQFLAELEAREDGEAGYVLTASDATHDPKTGLTSGRYAFP